MLRSLLRCQMAAGNDCHRDGCQLASFWQRAQPSRAALPGVEPCFQRIQAGTSGIGLPARTRVEVFRTSPTSRSDTECPLPLLSWEISFGGARAPLVSRDKLTERTQFGPAGLLDGRAQSRDRAFGAAQASGRPIPRRAPGRPGPVRGLLRPAIGVNPNQNAPKECPTRTKGVSNLPAPAVDETNPPSRRVTAHARPAAPGEAGAIVARCRNEPGDCVLDRSPTHAGGGDTGFKHDRGLALACHSDVHRVPFTSTRRPGGGHRWHPRRHPLAGRSNRSPGARGIPRRKSIATSIK